MSRWPSVELGEVLHTQIDAVESAELETVNLAGVYGFARGLFKREPISPLDTTYKRFHRLNAGDFVISSPKAWEGAIARIPEEFDGWFLSPVFPTFRANPDRLNTRYLDWYCKREAVWTQLQGKAKGMGARRESVSPAQFLSLNIPLPTIDEQQCIVARLDQLAEKVRQIDQHLDAIDAVAEALLISLHHKFAAERMVRLGDIIELFEESELIKPDGQYPQVGVRGFGGGLRQAGIGGNGNVIQSLQSPVCRCHRAKPSQRLGRRAGSLPARIGRHVCLAGVSNFSLQTRSGKPCLSGRTDQNAVVLVTTSSRNPRRWRPPRTHPPRAVFEHRAAHAGIT